MHFALTEEQHELVRTVRRVIAGRADKMGLRESIASDAGYDAQIWRTLCDQVGVAALAVPEEYGGAGFTYLETHLVLEELGRGLTPSPLLGSGILATQALLLGADAESCERLLPPLCEGSMTAALCWPAQSTSTDADENDRFTASADASEWRISGAARLVIDGPGADILLVVAHTSAGQRLFEVSSAASGVEVETTPALDPTLRFATVRLSDAPAVVLGGDIGDVLARLGALGVVAVTALQSGGARRAFELTVAYLSQREQFGRPLASFQALKHRCADLLVDVETATSMSWAAAWAAAFEPSAAPRRASAAKAWCTQAFDHAAAEMVQLHGGIGITWEHDAHLYFKRAHATAQLFGGAAQHRAALLVEP